jgi:hypothetical protein
MVFLSIVDYDVRVAVSPVGAAGTDGGAIAIVAV